MNQTSIPMTPNTTSEPIAFTKVKLPYGWLSNMAPFPIVCEDKEWRTSEALFQALRFSDEKIREAIRAEKSPMAAKMVAKGQTDFMTVKPQSLEDLVIMYRVLNLKLECHPNLRDELLATAPRTIIEDCTRRPRGSGLFWGAALKEDGSWEGRNVLGQIWMRIRDKALGVV